MICKKCKTTMKCEGTSIHYQDWFCPMCGFSKKIKRELNRKEE